MTERQIVNWLLGFVIGILTVLAWQRVMNEPLLQSDSEATQAEELISIYKRGVRDALKTNPVSFELEQVCLGSLGQQTTCGGEMSKPETLKDIIDETMRVSGVSYPVPVREKQFGGDHYKRMGIEPWDVVDTWPLEQRVGYYRGGALKYTMRMGNKDERLQEAQKGLHYQEKLVDTLKKAQDENS
jgi:hypothetical protein